MNAIYFQQTVGSIVTENPGTASALEELGVDYCCGGKKTLAEACQEKGLDPRAVLRRLQQDGVAEIERESAADVTSMSLTELADHIEKTNHVYSRRIVTPGRHDAKGSIDPR